jgi:CRP/FNR family transcriptional regulator
MQNLSDFVRQHPVRSYRKNETIIFQDDQPATMFFIKSGYIKGYDIDSQGAEQLLWIGSPGDFFPIVWAFSITPTVKYFVSAFTDAELYAVKRTEFNEFLEKNPVALQELTRQMAIHLNHTYSQLSFREKPRAEEKVAHSLHYLSERFGNTERQIKAIQLPITHQDLASLIGISRETVTVELKKLKDEGYIYYDKYQFIVHQKKLDAMLY